MADTGAPSGAHYRAFISYSHLDAAWGRRLHRQLEAYALPKRLVGKDTPKGPVPARLTPIFRDRDELPAANDLSAEVRAALAASDHLIVVCSPRARVSPWVAREIEVFRALPGDRPVLAALIEGTPDEAFPEAIFRPAPGQSGRIEPSAADFRPGGDGRRLAFLKLVAGLAGVSLDTLVQRDAQRLYRRVTAVTLSALLALLVMALLLIAAVTARARAERERGKAEGLVEFMLTDLRDRLKGVGRLDVLSAVNRRALDYYGDQTDLDRLPVASLERRARILLAMGEDDEARGDLAAALASFTEAHRSTSALLAKAPDDPDRIFNHAQSEYWVALLNWRRGHIAAADAGFRRYADLARRLLAIDAANPAWQMEMGYAESNLATLQLRDQGDAASALQSFERALSHIKAAAARKPDDADIQRELADAYAWLADAQRGQRRFGDALANRASEERLLLSLRKADPENAVYARDLLGNALGIAQTELDAGRPGAARARLSAAYADATRLAATDPSNMKLAKQRIAIGLFLVKAIRMLPSPSAADQAQAATLLRSCTLAPARADDEIVQFCAIVGSERYRPSARAGAAEPAGSHKLSPRWGIDFVQERTRLTPS